jgi:hypothetical protein
MNTSLLHTLPYAFDTFCSTDDRQSKSTSPYELNYSSYNHVYTLDHTKGRGNFPEQKDYFSDTTCQHSSSENQTSS